MRRHILREANETIEQKVSQLRKRGKFYSESDTAALRELQQCIDCDPTADSNRNICGKFTDWLFDNREKLASLLKDDARYRDDTFATNQIRDLLARFVRSKQRIVAAGFSPNIQTYDADEFLEMMYNMQKGENWKSSFKKLEGQYKLIANTQESVVVEPLTWAAERYFGQHTNWCTVGGEDYWRQYSMYGHIFIIIPKDEDGYPDLRSDYKWQCSFSKSQGVNCADADDNTYKSLYEMFCDYNVYEDLQAIEAIGQICPQIADTNQELDERVSLFAKEIGENPYSMTFREGDYYPYIITEYGDVFGVVDVDKAISMMTECYVDGMCWTLDDFEIEDLDNMDAIDWRSLKINVFNTYLNGDDALKTTFNDILVNDKDDFDIENYNVEDYEDEDAQQIMALYDALQGKNLKELLEEFENACIDWKVVGRNRAETDADWDDFSVLGTNDKFYTASDGYTTYVYFYRG